MSTLHADASIISKIIAYAESMIGSTKYHGRCQAFVYRAVSSGIGDHTAKATARDAREAWMGSGTKNNLKPPIGAAVYFKGTFSINNPYWHGSGISGDTMYGHVALSAGNGYIYDPVDTIKKVKLRSSMNGGYLGWGWDGGVNLFGSGLLYEDEQAKKIHIKRSLQIQVETARLLF